MHQGSNNLAGVLFYVILAAGGSWVLYAWVTGGSVMTAGVIFVGCIVVASAVFIVGQLEPVERDEGEEDEPDFGEPPFSDAGVGKYTWEPESDRRELFDEVSVLVKVPTNWEASIIAGLLADHDVEAKLGGTQAAGFRAEAPSNVNVIVRRKDVDRARQVLRESYQRDLLVEGEEGGDGSREAEWDEEAFEQ